MSEKKEQPRILVPIPKSPSALWIVFLFDIDRDRRQLLLVCLMNSRKT